MTNIMRWDPMSEMRSLKDTVNRLFESSFLKYPQGVERGIFQPPMDMVEGDNEVTVRVDIPGFKSDDVEVSVTEDLLTIKGTVSQEREESKGRYHLKERSLSTFSRTLPMPTKIKPGETSAAFKNGTLTITLPKADEVKARSVRVKVE